MTISQRIFSILKEKKKKQKELSAYTGISEAAISDWKKKELTHHPIKYSLLRIF